MHDALVPSDQVDDFIILRAVAFTSKIRQAVTRDVLAREDLPLIEWRLMFSVARFGTCHLAHITRHTSLDPAHGSRAAAALEKKGLIERHDDPDNRRRKLISLTPMGKELFNRIWPSAQEMIRQITDHLSPDDFETLKRLLDILNSVADPVLQDEQQQGDTAQKTGPSNTVTPSLTKHRRNAAKDGKRTTHDEENARL